MGRLIVSGFTAVISESGNSKMFGEMEFWFAMIKLWQSWR
uniref:Uncharacterized protein n=1 Tax=Yersinia enterocolitica W22703 TaxID=913028 RepID=F4MYF4_YEREN|nr:unknown protein [Yersinia enterocolitica W22703]